MSTRDVETAFDSGLGSGIRGEGIVGTLEALSKTASSITTVELALREALESENELTEPPDADERLLTLMGLRDPHSAKKSGAQTDKPAPPKSPKSSNRPGNRSPNRDAIGQGTSSEGALLPAEEAAG